MKQGARFRRSRISNARNPVIAFARQRTRLSTVSPIPGPSGWLYILGAWLRRTKEVRDVVLSDPGPFETMEVARQRRDPVALQVKEVTVHDAPGKAAESEPPKPRRYVVCRNPDQARKDAATREQILAALENKLRSSGPKGVVANKVYKRYLKAES